MRKRIAASDRWTWCSAALCLAAAGCLAWQLWQSDDIAPVSAPASASDDKTAEGERQLASFQLAPAEDFEEILARPLFNRSRRPDLAQENPQGAGGSEEAAASQISLNGIVLAGGKRTALLRLDGDAKVMHVAEGQRAGGWLIEAIRPDRVILRRGDAASEVALDYKRKNDAGTAQVGRRVEAAPQNSPPAALEGGATE
jgi:type II secretory pathway component PulC